MSQQLPGEKPKRLTGGALQAPKKGPELWRMRDKMPWLPYVLPLAVFLLLTQLESTLPGAYPLLYAIKIVAVVALLLALRRFLPEARPNAYGLVLAVALGVALTFVWVLGDRVTPHFAILGKRAAYDPFHEIAGTGGRAAFLALRFFGLVIVAPVVEEVFYRGFLLRYVTDPDDFRRVPVGRFTGMAFLFNVVLMAVSHPEWLVAAIFSAAMCSLLARTRNLFACIVAHGMTNLLLGVYVLVFRQWQYL